MEEVLQGQALVVDVKSAVVTAVGFQPLGGPELGEAGVTADTVNHVPIADLMLDLQRHHGCHCPKPPCASFRRVYPATTLGITGCYTRTRASAILGAGVDSGWPPLPKVSGATGRAEGQEPMSIGVGRSRSLIFSAGIRAAPQ